MTAQSPARPAAAHFRSTFLAPTETFVYEQLRALEAYEPIVLTRRRINEELIPWERVYATERLAPPRTRWATAASDAVRLPSPVETRAMSAVARRAGAAVLHAHFGPDGRPLLPVKRATGLPLVTTFYGHDVSSFPKRWGGLSRQLYRGLFRDGDAFLVLSEDMRRDLVALGAPEARIVVHHLGIDVGTFAFRPPRRPEAGEAVRFAAVGRIVEKKGFQPLVEAFARARREHPMHLTIVGEGPLRPQVEELVERNGLHADVSILGRRPHAEVAALMSASDVFVLPSVTSAEGDKEGTPTVLMEAMASGLPAISTRHAGIPEVVRDYETGLLVEERDVDGLARALVTAAGAADRWPEWAEAGRRHVEAEFNSIGQARRLEAIYDSLL